MTACLSVSLTLFWIMCVSMHLHCGFLQTFFLPEVGSISLTRGIFFFFMSSKICLKLVPNQVLKMLSAVIVDETGNYQECSFKFILVFATRSNTMDHTDIQGLQS